MRLDLNDKDGKRRDREHNVVTFILAGLLAAIVLGAIGYGIFKSSQITTAIPLLPTGRVGGPSAVTTGAR